MDGAGSSGIHRRSFLGNTEADAERRATVANAAAAAAGYAVVHREWSERVGRLTLTYARAAQLPAGLELAIPPWSSTAQVSVAWPTHRAPAPAAAYPAVPRTPAPAPATWLPPPALGRRSHERRLGFTVVLAVVICGALLGQSLSALDDSVEPFGEGVPPAAQGPAGTAIPAADDAGDVPRWEPGECRTDWLVGRETECGDLVVLARRDQPDGPRLRLHVAIHRTFHPSPRPDPVVYLDGGPGAAPLVGGALTHPFLDHRDLIVLDPRGAGLSEPSLDCPEVDEARQFGRWDEPIDVRTCRNRLLRQGADLGAYTSAALAADVADLRHALGYAEWNLYGVSYGSRLALTVMRDHPDGLRSAILDGVYPPHVDIVAETPANAQRAFDHLFDACAGEPVCAAAYPDLEARFYDLVDRLNDDPYQSGEGVLESLAIDGTTVMHYLFDSLYATEFLGDIPMSIAAFEEGDFYEIDLWVEFLQYRPRAAPPSSSSEGLYYSIECAEEMPFTDRDRLDDAAPGVRDVTQDAFSGHPLAQLCDLWAVPAASGVENRPVSSDVPVLLLAGEYDPITPPAWAASAAETLPNGWLLTLPGAGHGAVGVNACVDGVVSRFLDDPAGDPSGPCLDELAEPRFRTR